MTERIRSLRNRRLLAIATLLAVACSAAYAASCPIDQSSAYFTGKTRVDRATGKLLKEYKCARGHEFWVPG